MPSHRATAQPIARRILADSASVPFRLNSAVSHPLSLGECCLAYQIDYLRIPTNIYIYINMCAREMYGQSKAVAVPWALGERERENGKRGAL